MIEPLVKKIDDFRKIQNSINIEILLKNKKLEEELQQIQKLIKENICPNQTEHQLKIKKNEEQININKQDIDKLKKNREKIIIKNNIENEEKLSCLKNELNNTKNELNKKKEKMKNMKKKLKEAEKKHILILENFKKLEDSNKNESLLDEKFLIETNIIEKVKIEISKDILLIKKKIKESLIKKINNYFTDFTKKNFKNLEKAVEENCNKIEKINKNLEKTKEFDKKKKYKIE
jgi:hypothetical protein